VNSIVLDSSAVLAFILKEPGGERVGALLDALDRGERVEAALCSVNWCEILTRLNRDNQAMAARELAALLAGVEFVPFGREEADRAADYARMNLFLSLGDRACLALASARGAKAWTTDKLWTRIKNAPDLEILR
jgi:PIN domain nuclease of toxin-antitoxin system